MEEDVGYRPRKLCAVFLQSAAGSNRRCLMHWHLYHEGDLIWLTSGVVEMDMALILNLAASVIVLMRYLQGVLFKYTLTWLLPYTYC